MDQERPASDIEPRDPAEEAPEALDTEGSSMLVYELGLATETERRRQAEQASRATHRPGQRPHRRLVDRIRGR